MFKLTHYNGEFVKCQCHCKFEAATVVFILWVILQNFLFRFIPFGISSMVNGHCTCQIKYITTTSQWYLYDGLATDRVRPIPTGELDFTNADHLVLMKK